MVLISISLIRTSPSYIHLLIFIHHPFIHASITCSGIETTHSDFSGRAEWGNDFVDSYSPGTDLHGHGTHCAGTVMADTWGLAKKATAIAVRVLDEYGYGYVRYIINQELKCFYIISVV